MIKAKYWKLFLLFSLGLLIVLSFNQQPLFARVNRSNPVVAREQTNSNLISGRDLLNQGQQLYQQGQFREAIAVWQQAARIFSTTDKIFDRSLTLGYIASAWERLGEWQSGKKAISDAWQLLATKNTETKNTRDYLAVRARLFNIQGQLELSQGKASAALMSWQNAETSYRQLQDLEGEIGSQINQAKALQISGLYRRAQKILEATRESIEEQPDSLLKAKVWHNLGRVYWHLGYQERSQKVLEASLTLEKQLATAKSHLDLELASLQSDTLLSLGNTLRERQNNKQALKYYQEGEARAITTAQKIKIQVHQFSLFAAMSEWQSARTLWQKIKVSLPQLPLNQQTIYTRIKLAESQIEMRKRQPKINDVVFSNSEISNLLDETITQSQKIGDRRSESIAIGVLGYWHEQNRSWERSQNLTQQALNLAKINQSPEIAYRWQWQLGRLQKAQGDTETAIAFYREAVETLQLLRRDLVTINTEIQFSFQERVEPVYRQLVELLLQHEPPAKISQQNLQQARQIIESLQVAELENFFHEVCLTVKSTNIDRLDPKTAVIYPIILPQKLAVIVSLPQQPLTYYETAIAKSESEALFDRMRQSLRQTSFATERLPIAQQVYDLLIRPGEAQFTASKVTNLAFVLDGILKTLPMSALHDGQQYLIEKYSIALAPGMQLLETNPSKRNRLQGLVGALSEERQGFSPLPAVIQEIEQVSQQISTQVLLNRDFTRNSIHKKVEYSSFPVLHLATHGQFSSEVDETFILAWDGKINVRELARWLQLRRLDTENPIELLVLSACETAAGDRNAALGMAGVAVRSGVRSTIASLWSVQDNSTAILMTKFYQELSQNKISKAEALRRSQLALLKQPEYQHPYYWASFILIGNWL